MQKRWWRITALSTWVGPRRVMTICRCAKSYW
nr:MAG TPA: hypothetical protein [Caudoviricetes sp.]